MTPIEIEVALHYYAHADDWRGGDFSAPVCEDMFKWFVENDLLRPNQDTSAGSIRFLRTPRLDAFVNLLCKTPLPVQVWVHPNRAVKDGPALVVREPQGAYEQSSGGSLVPEFSHSFLGLVGK